MTETTIPQPSNLDIVNTLLFGANMLKKQMSFDYLAESELTASGEFHTDKVDPEILHRVITDCIESLQALDKIKKSLFYGRELTGLPAKYTDGITNGCTAYYQDTDIVHAILGMATEAGELLEALAASVFNEQPLDYVNIYEEVGDSQWYEAMILRRAGKTFDDVQRNNIAKLRARFGGKFTEYDANNRDLATERKILEDGVA